MKKSIYLFLFSILVSCQANKTPNPDDSFGRQSTGNAKSIKAEPKKETTNTTTIQEKETKYEICTKCRGTGELICSKCSGTGHIDHVCSGPFVEKCKSCEGYGAISNGTEIVKCPKCNGRGTSCYDCEKLGKGNGENCYTCEGYGYSICSTCNGKGEVKSILLIN